MLRVLIVENSLTDADTIVNVLRSAGHAIRATREDQLQAIEQALSGQVWDLVICRDSLETFSANDVLGLIKRLDKDVPCLVLVNDAEAEQHYLTTTACDVVVFSDTLRLQFATNREVKNLFNRRLARRNERALRESEKRSKTLLDSSRDAVAYMHEGMHIYVNSSYLQLFGYEEAEDVAGLPILDLFSSADHGQFKTVFREFTEQSEAPPVTMPATCIKSDGSSFEAEIELSHAKVEDEDCTQVVIRDNFTAEITPDLSVIQERDLLTGLISRDKAFAELERQVIKASKGEGDAQLLLIELDDFHAIKEELGLGNSELVIRGVAELLRKSQLEQEVLSYYGEHIFTVLIPNLSDDEVDKRAENYLQVVANYVTDIESKPLTLRCSIGIARVNESQVTAEAILNNADKACYQAKRSGGNQIYRFQNPPEVEDDKADEAWQNTLQKALKDNDFVLHFQAIASLHGEEQELYEVLLRLQQGDELIKPSELIEKAAKLKMMSEIDKWVIRTAMDRLVQHQLEHPKTRFFIKLSEQSIVEPSFVDWLTASLTAHNINANSLIFEVGEVVAVDHVELSQKVITDLKTIGCEFALEHFGSGIDFSNSLDNFNVDYLKINGTFIESMANDVENQAAIKAIIDMSKQAGKQTVAEFVSDANSLALLWRLGVDYAQGFYIQEPSPDLEYQFTED